MMVFDIEQARRQASDRSVISFDVFDTLLVRISSDPNAVFHLVENRYGFRGFTDLRMACETEARQSASAAGREDTNLDEIYQLLLARGGAAYLEARARECELEKSLLRPNPEICELLREFHGQGKRIVVTSDMYHSSAFIYDLLSDLQLPIERVFVSSETGCLKRTGNMFRHVVEELGVSVDDVLHIGDNWLADIKPARAAGVSAAFYPKLSVQASASPVIPDAMLTLPPERVFACLSAGQACYRWLVDKKPVSRQDLQWWIGYTLLGPLSRLFVEWLYRQARTSGIKHLFFLRRDGELWHRLLRSHYPEVTSELIYGNRKLLQDADLEKLLSLDTFPTDHAIAFRISHGDSIGNIAADLDFDEDLRLAIQRELEASGQWEAASTATRPGLFLAFIKRHPELWRSHAFKRRSALTKYYTDRGVTADRVKETALVDIGWRLSSFRSLGSVLGFDPQGLFFGVARGAYFGRKLKGFLFDYGAPADAFELYRPHFIEVLETLFGGCEPTAISIRQDGEVILDQIDDCEKKRIEFIRACYEGAAAFNTDLSQFTDYVSAMPEIELRQTARDLADRMINSPEDAFFDTLSGLQFSAYAGRSGATRKPLRVAWRQALDAASTSAGQATNIIPTALTAGWSEQYTRSLLPSGIFHILSRFRVNRLVRLIEGSGLFDEGWYASEYPDVPKSGFSPVEHYVRQGVFRGYNPSKSFSTLGYLCSNPDVALAGMNPLAHYIQHGQFELRNQD